MAAEIEYFDREGERRVLRGATVPLIIWRQWGEGAELRKHQIIRRIEGEPDNWVVLQQVERVEYATDPASVETLDREQGRLEDLEAAARAQMQLRDEAVCALVERGWTPYAIGKRIGMTHAGVTKILRRSGLVKKGDAWVREH